MNIVLIHGLAGSGRYFQDLELKLQAIPNTRTYAIDLLGFGQNAKHKGPFVLDKQLEYITEKVNSVVGSSEMVVIGHFMGGILAANWAFQHTARVKGIVLLNTPLGSTREELEQNIGSGETYGWGYLILRHRFIAFLSCKLLCKLNLMRFFRKFKPAYVSDEVFKDYRLHTWTSVTQNFKNVILTHPLMPTVLKIKEIPILNIVATHDNPISQNLIEGKNVINETIEGEHNLLLEKPEDIFNLIKQFILSLS